MTHHGRSFASSSTAPCGLPPQSLSVRWDELTAGDFVAAIHKAQNTCVLPFGILEKHGPHLPIGTDLINVRWASLKGAEQEYAVVFPEYYFGQIFEARHEPGTIAYSSHLQLELLQETTAEMARNGCKKIVIVNGHGSSSQSAAPPAWSQLDALRIMWCTSTSVEPPPPGRPPLKTKPDSTPANRRPRTLITVDLKLDRATTESGADRNRIDLPAGTYTGIWWYAKFPDHYSGDGSAATKELGEFDMKA